MRLFRCLFQKHLLTYSSSQLGHTQWQTKEEKAQFLGQLKIKN